jgi:hypothetical protein
MFPPLQLRSLQRRLPASIPRPTPATWRLCTGSASLPLSTFCKTIVCSFGLQDFVRIRCCHLLSLSLRQTDATAASSPTLLHTKQTTKAFKIASLLRSGMKAHCSACHLVTAVVHSTCRIILAVGSVHTIRFLALPNLEKVEEPLNPYSFNCSIFSAGSTHRS